jgi:hypothetical protein
LLARSELWEIDSIPRRFIRSMTLKPKVPVRRRPVQPSPRTGLYERSGSEPEAVEDVHPVVSLSIICPFSMVGKMAVLPALRLQDVLHRVRGFTSG